MLTPREAEVLDQIVLHCRSNKEAGRALGISPRTIEVHRYRIMEKYKARNLAHLIQLVGEKRHAEEELRVLRNDQFRDGAATMGAAPVLHP